MSTRPHWLAPGHQSTDARREHRDINEVMLAASLVPRGSVVMEGSPS
jgi:hypothetical protein